jgi:phosphoesterase RecJ-like protein
MESVAEKLRLAQSIVLCTHRHCDGDGLGAQVALFHALRKADKAVRILNADPAPRKYSFLATDQMIEVFGQHRPLAATDLALILDTNDERLVEPVFSELKRTCREILFIDHHPSLVHGPAPTAGSVIDTEAASTGELAYRLIRLLGIELDPAIARALYTSLVFDTQLFRFVRNNSSSHLMAAELLAHETEPEEIHRRLFATYTVRKMNFLARALASALYLAGDRAAVLQLSGSEIREHGLEPDESLDAIDLIMNIESLEVAALLREDAPGLFKLSLRSKGGVSVLDFAESFGGGGHAFSAGATIDMRSLTAARARDQVFEKISRGLVQLVASRRQGEK